MLKLLYEVNILINYQLLSYKYYLFFQGIGSVKDGKMGLVKHGPLPGEGEPLHAFITGTTPEIVAKAAEKVYNKSN